MERIEHPKVGMAATLFFYTDRRAATVVAVTRCTVTVQEDRAKRTDGNGMSDVQTYEFERDPNGATWRFWKRGDRWARDGVSLGLGFRRHYYDFGF